MSWLGAVLKYLWKIWAKSLGGKASKNDDRQNDHVAIARTIIILIYIITNLVIISGVIHHW